MSMATTLPRKSASRKGASTFSQVSFVSSGAGPRSGREEAGDAGCVTVSLPVTAVAQAVNPKINPSSHNRFMCSLLDVPILGKLSYEKVTQG
jgi:hypothetical protein